MAYRLTATRHKLVQCWLMMNKLIDTVRKREEPENVETLKESEYKETLYLGISTYEQELKHILDILAPDAASRETYYEPVEKAKATVDFPPGF